MAIILIAENFNKRTFFRRDESVSFSDVTAILKALPEQPSDEFAKDDWYHMTQILRFFLQKALDNQVEEGKPLAIEDVH